MIDQLEIKELTVREIKYYMNKFRRQDMPQDSMDQLSLILDIAKEYCMNKYKIDIEELTISEAGLLFEKFKKANAYFLEMFYQQK